MILYVTILSENTMNYCYVHIFFHLFILCAYIFKILIVTYYKLSFYVLRDVAFLN
jgi:hypothetical protein